MRKMSLFLVLSITMAMLAASQMVMAQGGGGQRGGGMMGGFGGGAGQYTLLTLATNATIAKEIKVTDEQKTKLDALTPEMRADRQEMMQSMGGGGGGPGSMTPEEMAKRQAEMQKLTDKYDKKVGEILTPEQLARLKELRLQAIGPTALSDKDVAKELNLTTDQKVKMKAAEDDAAKKRQALFADMQGGGGDRAAMQTKMKEISDALLKQLVDALTPEQKAQYEKMKGVKLDIDWTTIGGRGGARGGAGGGRGNRGGGAGG
jgi:Spy/CpxP family protein refolding chaperone